MGKELSHEVVTLELNINPFLANAKQLESHLNREAKLMNTQKQTAKLYGNSISSLGNVYSTQSRMLQGYNKLLEDQAKRVKNAQDVITEATSKNGKATADQERALSRATQQYAQTQEKIRALSAEMVKNKAQIIANSNSMYQFAGKVENAGKKITSISKGLTAFGKTASMFSVPLIAGFAKSAQAAIKFKSEIAEIGPLLTNGGRITATVQKQLDNLSASSLKWSKYYGISTTSINQSMAELVRRGFTASQTMGSMKSILDATRASGEDMSDVMNVTASVIEQFGLKANTTAQQTKNTKMAVDALTYVANATASDFKTMGDSMTYAGPIAAQAGMSIQETAAALGLMANRGIEASAGGTALRAALSRLLTPSKAIDAKMKDLGVNLKDFRSGAIGLPEVLDQISNGVSKLPKPQRAGAIAAAFGKQAQGFSTLIAAGGNELRKYTENAEKASGTTAKIAKQLNNTPQAKIERFKESLNALAITMGDKLLPNIMPVVEDLTKMVNKFGELPDGTQKAIVKTAAFAALLGPLSLGVGKLLSPLGKLTTLLGNRGQKAILGNILKQLQGQSIATATGVSGLESALGSTGVAMTGVSAKSALFSTSLLKTLSVFGPIALATTAGITLWELWGKKVAESRKRTERWGTDVGKQSDQVLDKMTLMQTETKHSLDQFGDNIESNSKKVSTNFKNMAKEVKNFAKEANSDITSAYNKLDPALQELAKGSTNKKLASNNNAATAAKQQSDMVQKILVSASKQRRDLTVDERNFITNSQRIENEQLVSLLNISSAKRKKVLKALNGEIGNLTQTQARDMIKTVSDQGKKVADSYQKQFDAINKLEKKGAISSKEATKMRSANSQAQQRDLRELAASAYELQLKYGDLNKVNEETGRTSEEARLMFQRMGISVDYAKQAYDSIKKSTDSAKDSLVALGNTKADKMWNNNFLYDAEKGVIRTKDQLVDFIAEATKSKDKWNNLKFVIKKAKVTKEGLETISQGIEKAKAWDKVDLKTWTAMVETKWGKGAESTFEWWQAHGVADKKSLELAMTGDFSKLSEVINDAKTWNAMELGTKELFVKDKASIPFIDALTQNDAWNNLPVKVKTAVVNGKMAKKELGMLSIQYGVWDSLPDSTKNALLKDDDFIAKLKTLAEQSKDFSTKNIVKKILGDNSPLQQEINKTNTILGVENKKQPKSKVFNGDNHNLLNTLSQGNIKFDKYEAKKPKPKVYKADGSNMIRNTRLAQNPLDKFNRTKPGVKNLVGKDKASGAANAARNAVSRFGGNETITKRFNFVANISNNLKKWWNHSSGAGYNATGTRDWRGGLSWVGDGGRSEVVYQPKSKLLITTPPTDTLMPLEKHAIVWPSVNNFKRELSKSFPRYAAGTANRVVETAKYIPGIKQFANGTANNAVKAAQRIPQFIENATPQVDVSGLLNMMSQLINVIKQDLGKPMNVEVQSVMDGRAVGRGSAKYVRQEINRQEVQERRNIGIR